MIIFTSVLALNTHSWMTIDATYQWAIIVYRTSSLLQEWTYCISTKHRRPLTRRIRLSRLNLYSRCGYQEIAFYRSNRNTLTSFSTQSLAFNYMNLLLYLFHVPYF